MERFKASSLSVSYLGGCPIGFRALHLLSDGREDLRAWSS